jgi:hypothetical protein
MSPGIALRAHSIPETTKTTAKIATLRFISISLEIRPGSSLAYGEYEAKAALPESRLQTPPFRKHELSQNRRMRA